MSEHTTDAPPPVSPRSKPDAGDPGQFVCRWKPFSIAAMLTSTMVLGGGYLLAQHGGMNGAIAFVLICTTIGLTFTLAATAWGALISLTESPLCGALFVFFPPYMFYYGISRWRWMSQPSILFLCGMALMIGSIVTGRQLLAGFAGE